MNNISKIVDGLQYNASVYVKEKKKKKSFRTTCSFIKTIKGIIYDFQHFRHPGDGTFYSTKRLVNDVIKYRLQTPPVPRKITKHVYTKLLYRYVSDSDGGYNGY